MSQRETRIEQWLRPRARPRRARRHRPLALRPATAAAGHAGARPGLSMGDAAADRRRTFLCAATSVAIHALLFALLAFSAWQAPRIAEQVIPVRILHELPGAKEEPAPLAPRALAPRRAVRAAPRVAPQAPEAPRTVAVTPPQAPPVRARAREAARIEAAAAPTALPRPAHDPAPRTPQIAPAAASNDAAPRALDVARLPTRGISPIEVQAPTGAPSGPRAVRALAPTAVTGPRALAPTTPVLPGAATRGAAVAATDLAPAQVPLPALDIGVADAAAGIGAGGGVGGDGVATDVARCQDSAFVQRYFRAIEQRTLPLWHRASEVPEGARVVLRFRIDEAGSATGVEVVEASDPALGETCRRALIEASPFPALDDRVRCIASLPGVRATFTGSTERR